MKKGIHPEFVTTKVTCACGNEFETKSSKSDIVVDVCGACHPFYTGSEKVVDTTGRIDKFNRKYNLSK
jgi:large subunit ribosomal protein L31